MANQRGPKKKKTADKKDAGVVSLKWYTRWKGEFKPCKSLQGRALEIFEEELPNYQEDLLHPPDMKVFSAYCRTLAHIEAVQDEFKAMENEGINIFMVTNDRGVITEHPIWRTLDRLEKLLLSQAKALGLTPGARGEFKPSDTPAPPPPPQTEEHKERERKTTRLDAKARGEVSRREPPANLRA